MREINTQIISNTIKELFLEANYVIGKDVTSAVKKFLQVEPSPIGRSVLCQILENNEIASSEKIAICQDTGMAIVFAQIGQDVHITGGGFETAINHGVEQAYLEGYLRKSVVDDPVFQRNNTQNNTPAIVHTTIVDGDKIKLIAVAKGFGSENMSSLSMLTPAEGVEGVKRVVLETVKKAGPNPCPPIVVGVGIGGSMEKASLLAKSATIRELGSHNSNSLYENLEIELLTAINNLGIGPSGTGGKTTAIGVNVEYFPTHIAAMPVAVNICCHAVRHAQRII